MIGRSLSITVAGGAVMACLAVTGLDHVVVAVTDLDDAASRYRRLGFALKPGRPHGNGIRNQHVKFADGTEIELITASEANDALTSEYVRHLEHGDGPAFVGLYAPELDAVAERLAETGEKPRRAGALLTFPAGDPLHYLFFGGRNRSPSDEPAHFAHANGAAGLIGVWIAGADLSAEIRLLERLGATIGPETVFVPEMFEGTVARLPEAEVILLPSSYRQVEGRKIVGVTLRTPDLDRLRRLPDGATDAMPPVVATPGGRSVFLPPASTNGIWLEFREDRSERPTP